MTAIQQWWSKGSNNIGYEPPPPPSVYRLVWDHSLTPPSPTSDVPNANLGESTSECRHFTLMEYSSGFGPGTGAPLPLSSVVLTVTTTRLTNNEPGDTAVYEVTTDFPNKGIIHTIGPDLYSGVIYNKRTSPTSTVLSNETTDIIITAVVNGVAAQGTLRMRSTPVAPPWDAHLNLSFFRT